MGIRDVVFVGAVLGAAGVMGAGVLRPGPSAAPPERVRVAPGRELDAAVSKVDASLRKSWDEAGVRPVGRADDLAYLRRVSLALTGSIPSLEELRRYEALPAAGRREAWVARLLQDRRTTDYLAERLARVYVGTEDGPFLLFRRRRFTTWLSDALLEDRPYDAIVRDMIADDGLWTDHPATNFITSANDMERERPDPERLAVRVARSFLGIRLDCAQCHDHPFADWKQQDFQGLAAFFGSVHADLRGTRDTTHDYQPNDRKTGKSRPMAPKVPFAPECLPSQGGPRERLAAWLVDPAQGHLARATVNRMWGLLYGKPLVDPVDDLPPEADQPETLRLLAADFGAHGYRLHRLIRVMTRLEAFQLDSALPDGEGPTEAQEGAWAAFPLTPLRPEQVARSVHQGAVVRTIGPDSPWLVRLFAYTGRNDFVRRYGDTGEDEFGVASGTIPQRLLLMNGKIVSEKTKPDLFNAATRIAQLAPDDRAAIEAAYLTVLTRRPTPEERAHFVSRIKGREGDARSERLSDLCWTLLNATEFSWNH